MTKPFIIFISCLLTSSFSLAEERTFSQCIADWQAQGKANNLPTYIVDKTIPGLRHLPKILEYDRRQPEFTQTFAHYLNLRVTPARVDKGQRLLNKHRDFLQQLTREHGVPGRYLIAFWGLESNFGAHLGKMPILDSLATLACDPRRSGFFTEELMTALALMHRESFTAQQMHGSWAGAMGHTQFMPSAYSQYAIDGDSDSQINLWKSKRDALASGANFLKHLGWQAEQRWGREVLLPDDFPYAETGLNNKQALSYWGRLGVSKTNQLALPELDLPASILVPAGHTGPAFIVYPNFDVIMKWNRSESYALSVGLLADQIAGAGSLTRPPNSNEKPLSRQQIQSLQQQLNQLGFDSGKPDGVMGSMTRNAIRAFQSSRGLIADGHPDDETLAEL